GSFPDNGHAPALQDRTVSTEQPDGKVEGNSRPVRRCDLQRGTAAGRCGQRGDRAEEIGATDTIGWTIKGPGKDEGGVRGGVVDVDLQLGNEVALARAGRGNDD